MNSKQILSIAVALALLLSACAFPQQGTDSPDEIGGDYYVNGVDARGKEYSGQLTVSRTNRGDDVDLQWIITGVVQTGAGTVDGDTLTADWETIVPAGSSTGTVIYILQHDGALLGERTFDDEDGVGTEEAFPVDLSG